MTSTNASGDAADTRSARSAPSTSSTSARVAVSEARSVTRDGCTPTRTTGWSPTTTDAVRTHDAGAGRRGAGAGEHAVAAEVGVHQRRRPGGGPHALVVGRQLELGGVAPPVRAERPGPGERRGRGAVLAGGRAGLHLRRHAGQPGDDGRVPLGRRRRGVDRGAREVTARQRRRDLLRRRRGGVVGALLRARPLPHHDARHDHEPAPPRAPPRPGRSGPFPRLHAYRRA